ncbi:hypothetical protein DFS33DRAFT_776703 [Desarmillaria ectypa]|nr:hypothetical protein DFS33DRAFT_776703 [Desarmillaria ectypa]
MTMDSLLFAISGFIAKALVWTEHTCFCDTAPLPSNTTFGLDLCGHDKISGSEEESGAGTLYQQGKEYRPCAKL